MSYRKNTTVDQVEKLENENEQTNLKKVNDNCGSIINGSRSTMTTNRETHVCQRSKNQKLVNAAIKDDKKRIEREYDSAIIKALSSD